MSRYEFDPLGNAQVYLSLKSNEAAAVAMRRDAQLARRASRITRHESQSSGWRAKVLTVVARMIARPHIPGRVRPTI